MLAESVLEAFVRLHDKGLIYRGSYLVNWSPGLQTGAPSGTCLLQRLGRAGVASRGSRPVGPS